MSCAQQENTVEFAPTDWESADKDRDNKLDSNFLFIRTPTIQGILL
ncbi:hypothetical protein Q31b_28470 [Novipirellula aureliae]|uniref:Uncharacterized protein n=1 Tax=Novipirellula aureliae TaxID=2527966 RepID=A0A5C6DVK4_9BACT|nr:hypothetical protein Q31b_28470 [Novipirellula aureliae]